MPILLTKRDYLCNFGLWHYGNIPVKYYKFVPVAQEAISFNPIPHRITFQRFR